MKKILEVCVDSVEGAVAAQEGGGHRIELCTGLAEGGTTPSLGTIEAARKRCTIGIVVLARPRGGDFLYGQAEFEVLKRDVLAAKDAGADGVGIGILRADGTLDTDRMAAVIDLARPLDVVCHRAFDMTRDPGEALEQLVELGVDRVLTSGQQHSAVYGMPMIEALVKQADGRIAVVPCGGVRPHNVREILDASGAREVQFTATKVVGSGMEYRNTRCSLASGEPPQEFERRTTDAEVVRSYLAALGEKA